MNKNHHNRIACIHLLNDVSGSPFIFKQAIEKLVQKDKEIVLFTNQNKSGFLSGIEGVQYKTVPYKLKSNKWLRLWAYTMNQFVLFWKIFFFIRKEDLVYINTILPFGAAYAAHLRGAKVIYHVHEVKMHPRVLHNFLKTVIRRTADKVIFVSNYVRKIYPAIDNAVVIHNALPVEFVNNIKRKQQECRPFNVLMICSLRRYKGVFEYIALAQIMRECQFTLVLNATEYEIKEALMGEDIPDNLIIHPTQQDVHIHYAKADVVINMTRPDECVESFGMTILEAMTYRLPVIIPPVGGITELVQHGKEGFRINGKNIYKLKEKIRLLATNGAVYHKMSSQAWETSKKFTAAAFGGRLVAQLSM